MRRVLLAAPRRRRRRRRRLVSTPGVDARLVLESFAAGPGPRPGPAQRKVQRALSLVSMTFLPRGRDRTCIVHHADSKTFIIGTRRLIDYSIIPTVFSDSGFDYRGDVMFKYRVLQLRTFDNVMRAAGIFIVANVKGYEMRLGLLCGRWMGLRRTRYERE